MQIAQFKWQWAVKAALAVASLSALAVMVGADVAPQVPRSTVLMYGLAGSLAALATMVVALIVSLTFNQFILRHGGTDPQWFWFNTEPRGLVRLRQELADQQGHQP